MLYSVITTSKSPGIADGLTYESIDELLPGTPVQVPLRQKQVEGIVIKQEKKVLEYAVKSISASLPDPLLTPAQLATAQWMSEYYCCNLRQALSPWLPGTRWSSLLKDDTETCPLQTSVSAYPNLTEKQQEAYTKIVGSDKPSLLFGVTNSGKTEVYAALVADAVQAKKQAILLVPEILLTEHTITRFEELLGGREAISIWHSRLTPAQRRKEWQRIRSGEVSLVIGSRSALFTPCQNLGVVIIDEEHEWTFKNEQTPRYHARETAAALCKHSQAQLVLGSATPSLESWSRAKHDTYSLVRLPDRYNNAPYPHVHIVDLAETNFGSLYPLSPTLLAAVDDRLSKKEQSILFLNRRGIATALLCTDCRRRVVSPETQIPFTVHREANGDEYLSDHFSGTQLPVPHVCPSCDSPNLKTIGAGTAKLEDLLKKQFPSARVLRADSDTLKNPDDMRHVLNAMHNNEADILLGTQSIVKGLDLPKVTLAGVLVADVGLSLPHFRAGERIFQLLTQLTGRSGRLHQGDVVIQTFRPDAPEIKAAAAHATEEFLDTELQLRQHSGYPPVVPMARIIVRSDNAKLEAKKLYAELFTKAEDADTIHCAPLYHSSANAWHVLIRSHNVRTLLAEVDLQNAIVDIDPQDCL